MITHSASLSFKLVSIIFFVVMAYRWFNNSFFFFGLLGECLFYFILFFIFFFIYFKFNKPKKLK